MGLVDKGRMPAPLTKLFNMSRSYSLWVYQWGLACCAIEMGAAFGVAALRRHAPRRDPAAGQPAPADSRLRLRHRHRQDGARGQAALGADARTEVRDLDGFVCQLWRPLLGLLLGHEGRRPDHSGRCLRARLPAPARSPCSKESCCCRADPERGHGRALEG